MSLITSASNLVNTVMSAFKSNSQEQIEDQTDRDFYGKTISSGVVGSYDRIVNIYTSFVSGASFYYQEGDGMDRLIRDKNLSLIIRESMNFIQKNVPDSRTGIVGYLLMKHDDVAGKQDAVRVFDNFEIITRPQKKLDRHKDRAIPLYDFRDIQTRASLILACAEFDEASNQLTLAALKSTKLVKTGARLPTQTLVENTPKDITEQMNRESKKLEEHSNFIMGQGEDVKSLNLSVDAHTKNLEWKARRLALMSGLNLASIMPSSESLDVANPNDMFILEVKQICNSWLAPLVNDILKKGRLKSEWHFKEFGLMTEKEKSESEQKYIATFTQAATSVMSILDHEKISQEIKDGAQLLLNQLLKTTKEKENS